MCAWYTVSCSGLAQLCANSQLDLVAQDLLPFYIAMLTLSHTSNVEATLMKRSYLFGLLTALLLSILSCSGPRTDDIRSRLARWRKGVWVLDDGSYTIYTDSHYFVLSASGDSSSANIYCGASQVQYHDRGMARKQVLRVRQLPGNLPSFFKEAVVQPDHTETPITIDTSQFAVGTCNIKNGIIYDSITEVADNYILLATCNGDRIKIFSNGVSVYLPAGGGEHYSYRIESL